MSTYQKIRKLNIDHTAIGLDQNVSETNYFCTPLGAEVIGLAGVDGIHYCFLRVCCSSMYFEKPEKIFWKLTFREKRIPDIEVQLV